jgi:biopolymer transport protein ExbD
MAAKKPQGAEHTNPNLIPMIDIMFLLLLFFMLGADMGHRELEDVRLPKAKEAKVDPPEGMGGRLTINAHHRKDSCSAYLNGRNCRDESHWGITFRGEDCTEASELSTALARIANPERKPLSEQRVMIRADGAAPFGLAQRAMNVCAKNGIYKVEVGAAKPQAR